MCEKMEQKEIVKNKAGVNKELKLSNGWDITKTDCGYQLSETNTFIHGDTIEFITKNITNAWLCIYQNNVYIATLWIDNAVEIKNIKEFIKVNQ